MNDAQLFLAALILGIALGALAGAKGMEGVMEGNAVLHGVAVWATDPATGKPVFKWKDEK